MTAQFIKVACPNCKVERLYPNTQSIYWCGSEKCALYHNGMSIVDYDPILASPTPLATMIDQFNP